MFYFLKGWVPGIIIGFCVAVTVFHAFMFYRVVALVNAQGNVLQQNVARTNEVINFINAATKK